MSNVNKEVTVGDTVRVSYTARVERTAMGGWIFVGGYWMPDTVYEVLETDA